MQFMHFLYAFEDETSRPDTTLHTNCQNRAMMRPANAFSIDKSEQFPCFFLLLSSTSLSLSLSRFGTPSFVPNVGPVDTVAVAHRSSVSDAVNARLFRYSTVFGRSASLEIVV